MRGKGAGRGRGRGQGRGWWRGVNRNQRKVRGLEIQAVESLGLLHSDLRSALMVHVGA